MASPSIELLSVSSALNNEVILNDVNLKVFSGEIFTVVGPSGQGKSVLLKIMAGLLPPSSGEVLIWGRSFFHLKKKEQDQVRRKMGMLFQKNALFDSLTALENIEFPLEEAGIVPSSKLKDRAKFFLREVGLGEAETLMPDEMSGGMRKRLGIARALALDPEIIFYDDPTAGLDPITSRKIVDLIIRLNWEKGSTAVVVTNEMNRAYQMGGRIGVLIKGELIITGTADETRMHKDPRVHQFVRGELDGPLTESL